LKALEDAEIAEGIKSEIERLLADYEMKASE
jgi:hypothetical protein